MCEYCRRYICPAGCPNAPAPLVFAKCSKCGNEILDGEDYYDIDGYFYCEDCIEESRKTAEAEDV